MKLSNLESVGRQATRKERKKNLISLKKKKEKNEEV